MTDIPSRRRRVFDDPLASDTPPAPVAGHPEAPEEDEAPVHEEADELTADPPTPTITFQPKPPAPAAQAAAPDPAAMRAERASLISDAIDRASFGITDEIDNLIARANRLKDFAIEDAARIKTQLHGHIENGTRVLDMARRIENELLELERNRRELMTAQVKD